MESKNSEKFPRLNLDRVIFALSILLLLIAIAYLSKGFYSLIIEDNKDGARDLFERWQEQQYIYQRQYPYYARQGSSNVIPAIGAIRSGGYPPWAFFTGFILIPKISWEAIRLYHAFLNLISLIVVGLFSYQIGLPYGKSKALFSMTAVLAIGSNCTTLNNGQYGLIINALLVGVYWGIKRHKYSWTGLILGLAMTKPNISAFYFFIPLVYRQFNAIITFLIYLIFGSIFISLTVQINFLEMMEDIFQQIKYFAAKGNPIVDYFMKFRLDPIYALLILGVIGVMTILIIFYLCRSYSLLTLFATAAVIGRIVTYHRVYDNLMVVFLLLAVIEMAWIKPDKFNYTIVLLVGLSLWLPAKIIQFKADDTTFIQFIIWLVALGYVFFQETKLKAQVNCKL